MAPVSYTLEDHGITTCGGVDIQGACAGKKSTLMLAPEGECPDPADADHVVRIPIASDFKQNPVALATRLFAALDAMPKPMVVACKSGRRAAIVATAWIAARNGGDGDAAVAALEAAGHADTVDKKHWVRGAVAGATVALTHPLIFRQLFEKESSTYTYLLGDATTGACILIDPVVETVDRDLEVVARAVTADGKAGLSLEAGVNTHCHADHITGTAALKERVPGCRSIISQASGAKADEHLKPGDRVRFGARYIEALPTPGHTDGCMSFVLDDRSRVFTGDALLIGGCGRTDFQQGSAPTLYKSVTTQLFTLPPDTVVCPAHDYAGRSTSSVLEERLENPRLGAKKTEAEFAEIMKNLNLAYPKKIDLAVPANLLCGYPDEASWKPAAKV